MKAIVIVAVIFTAVSNTFAQFLTLQEATSRLFTNTVVVWQAPTNGLPASFRVYKRSLPHVFSEAIASNAVALTSFRGKTFPKPSTNYFSLVDKAAATSGKIPAVFEVKPDDAFIMYDMEDYGRDPQKKIPDDAIVAAAAWNGARQLGLDPANLARNDFFTHYFIADDETGNGADLSGRGVFLSRRLDGLAFFTDGIGDGGDGFYMELGDSGAIECFMLRWSDFKPYQTQAVAGARDIVRCVQARKILVIPDANEPVEQYYGRLRALSGARKLTVTRVTPYYYEEKLGQLPEEGADTSRFINPVAVLDAVADVGTNSMTIHLLSPITGPQVKSLIGN
jgi:hypothetical protein